MNQELSDQEILETIELYENDPVGHIVDVQGVQTLEEYQTRICEAVRDYERVSIKACHDVGKTFTLAKIILWLGSTFPGAKIITTAPTHLQVEKLLWSEINSGYKASKMPLGGKMLTVEWKISDDWFALGMSPKDDAGDGSGNARFQGFHGDLVVVIFDEATGVSAQRYSQVEGMMTSANVKFICIGNPTTRSSQFFKTFSDPFTKKISISCFDSPNLKANGIKNIDDLENEMIILKALKQKGDDAMIDRINSYKIVQPKLITLGWVMRMAVKLGLLHPLFVSKVLGEFPATDDWAVVKFGDIEAAIAREADSDYRPKILSIGADPARFGSDSTSLTVLKGIVQAEKTELNHADTTETTNEICRMINDVDPLQFEKIIVVVDGTGIGAGVVDQLKQRRKDRDIPQKVQIREVHFGASPGDNESDKKHYVNLKAKIYDKLAEDVEKDLCLLNESVYLEETPMIRFSYDTKGRKVIESKDDFKKRTGLGSPDDSDSLALANYGRYAEASVGTFTKEMAKPKTRKTSRRPKTVAGGIKEGW